MKRLNDYKGTDAIILMGDILEDLTKLLAHPEVQKLPRGTAPFKIIAAALKASPEAVTNMASKIRQVPEEDINTWTLAEFTELFVELYSVMEIRSLFSSQSRAKITPASTGSATENTPDGKN